MGKKLFDYVIGNPPYNEDFENSGDNGNFAKPVYNYFMDATYDDLNIQCCGRLRGQVTGAVRDDIKHSHVSFSMRAVLLKHGIAKC